MVKSPVTVAVIQDVKNVNLNFTGFAAISIWGLFLTLILHGSNRLGEKALFWLEGKGAQQALI